MHDLSSSLSSNLLAERAKGTSHVLKALGVGSAGLSLLRMQLILVCLVYDHYTRWHVHEQTHDVEDV